MPFLAVLVFICKPGWIIEQDCQTFALETLAEESSQQSLAVLTHGGTRVRVNGECVWDLHFSHEDFVQVDRPSGVKAPGLTGGAGLETNHTRNTLKIKIFTCIHFTHFFFFSFFPSAAVVFN